MPDSPFSIPIDWQMNKREIWTMIGANGSGKSLLSEVIAGRYALKEGEIKYHFLEEMKMREEDIGTFLLPRDFIKIVSFDGAYSLNGFREIYYQQRFNSTESEKIPFVSDLIPERKGEHVVELLDIKKLLSRKLNQLSSGELRKLLIAKSLLDNPRMLIFDNPFIGLDIASRENLNEIFVKLSERGIQLLFLVPTKKDIPDCTTHILEIAACRVTWQGKFSEYLARESIAAKPVVANVDWSRFPLNSNTAFEWVVRMKNITIAYGDILINSGINWKIRVGEKWALLGPNGSGKSTLLSYIFADNPQAYAKQLWLFDQKRGSGESVWDIKRRIGFTSSEMHLHYRQNVSCLSVVSSGFFDSIGLFRKCTDEQLALARYLFEKFSISHLETHSFLKVSSGEQRLILFMRALIKNPELLILDEPFHGLDDDRKQFCTEIIKSFCEQDNKSLIYVTHRREEIPPGVNCCLELE